MKKIFSVLLAIMFLFSVVFFAVSCNKNTETETSISNEETTTADVTTAVSKEFSINFSDGCEPYYPINDKKNTNCYLKYKALSEKQKNCIFGGRLGEYKYYNMDDVIESALNMLDTL